MLECVQDDAGQLKVRATVRRTAFYLDNHSIFALAKGPETRRKRLIDALTRGADLMFSPMNAAEVIGPEHLSTIGAVKSFLNEVGPHWFPVEGPDVVGVVDREASGSDRSSACTSAWFMNQYFAGRSIQVHCEQRQGLFSADFFSLGFVLDWLHPHRADIRRRVEDFERQLADRLSQLRSAYEKNRLRFDEVLPPPRYDDAHPATFAWEGLIRTLVIEGRAYQFERGDGADFCHAIMASAFASFATLDKQWKRRVATLPKPNGLARVYYAPELDQLIDDVEAAVTARQAER